jgi:hypothetical protein
MQQQLGIWEPSQHLLEDTENKKISSEGEDRLNNI